MQRWSVVILILSMNSTLTACGGGTDNGGDPASSSPAEETGSASSSRSSDSSADQSSSEGEGDASSSTSSASSSQSSDGPLGGASSSSASSDASSSSSSSSSVIAGQRLDCVDWQSEHPAWLWCDDFENPDTLADNYEDANLGEYRFKISSTDRYGGDTAIEQAYQTGQVDAGWINWFYADAAGGDYTDKSPAQRDIYMRFYHKFEAGFEGMPPKMARIYRLEPPWNKVIEMHLWVNTHSPELNIVADIKSPDSSFANDVDWFTYGSDFLYSSPANIGRWVCLEMRLKNNTAGNNDGAIQYWADGELIIDKTEVDMTGDPPQDLNVAMLDAHWNKGSPKPQSRFYDNFVISTERIGCLH